MRGLLIVELIFIGLDIKRFSIYC